MSRAGFARVHPGLLARKGEAAPAALTREASVTYLAASAKQPAQPQIETGQLRDLEPDDETRGEHFRLSLRMSKEQRRKMWLVSAKLGLSRQTILDRALDAFMAELAGNEMVDCSCFTTTNSPGSCELGH